MICTRAASCRWPTASSGVLRAATLSVHAIGEGYAEVARTKPRFGVKQVDRFLSNTGHRRGSPDAVVGEVRARSTQRDRRGARLDRLREGRPHDAVRVPGDEHGRATPLTWKTVKKSTLAGHAQRLRVRAHRAAALGDRARRRGHTARRPRLRRPEALRATRAARLGLRDPLPRVHPGHRRDGERRAREDWVPATGARRCSATLSRHERPRVGPRRGRRARRRDEGAVVPGDDARDAQGARGRRALRQALHHRGDLPRRQGPPLRHGPQRDAHPRRGRRDRLLLLRDRARAAHAARRRQREDRHGPLPQGQYREEAGPIPSSARAPTGTARFQTCATTG